MCAQRQHLYFCTIKASKLGVPRSQCTIVCPCNCIIPSSTCIAAVSSTSPVALSCLPINVVKTCKSGVRQYLCFFTRSCVSICTFALANLVERSQLCELSDQTCHST